MLSEATTLILGAGASMRYGFPSGRELLFEITENLKNGVAHINRGGDINQSPLVFQACIWFKFSLQHIEYFAEALEQTKQPSIDAFLEMYPEFMAIGKVVIAASLIPLESPKAIKGREKGLIEWYEYFFNLLRNPNQIRRGNLSVVTFNYDRSFEYFLYYAFMSSYHLDSAQAIELMKYIPIIHIYGSLGTPKFLDQNGRDYETHVNMESIKKCIDELKIISEVQDSHSTLPQVYSLLSHAKKIVFLGFSFHPTNVHRLHLEKDKHTGRIFGTVYGMKQGEVSRVEELFDAGGIKNVVLHRFDALEFLRETNYI